MQKTRPCVVVSPTKLNQMLGTVLVAPMTASRRRYASRVICRFAGRDGEIALDQMRCMDKGRLLRRIGLLPADEQTALLQGLARLFAA
jgi:mRNA interferase MazF